MAEDAMRRGERGFTLIEVMIAMVLTAIAIMGIIALYITEIKAAGFSRHSTEAAVLAEDKIEKLRTQGAAVNIGATIENNINERGLPGGIFRRTYSEVVGLNFADITVSVTWSDDGIPHSLTVNARRNP